MRTCTRATWYDHFDDSSGAQLDTSCADPEHAAALARRRDRGVQWSAMVRGRDGGGARDFLDGRAIHCGTGLELQAVEEKYDDYGGWTVFLQRGVPVRYETAWSKDGPIAMIHVSIAGHEFHKKHEAWMRLRWPEVRS